MNKISREKYAQMYGATAGDRIRLADTSLIIEIEKDYAIYGEEAKLVEESPYVMAWDNHVPYRMTIVRIP